MPASNIDLYHHMQESRNNFDAMRPVPISADANHYMGQCQNNIHISTNCYYGYHDPKISENTQVTNDCEMMEEPHGKSIASPSTQQTQTHSRKRSADDTEMPQNKRFREGKVYFCYIQGSILSVYIVGTPCLLYTIEIQCSFNLLPII